MKLEMIRIGVGLAWLLLLGNTWIPGAYGSGSVKYNPHVRLSGEVFTSTLHASGSQYLFEEWSNGDVTLTTGAMVKGVSLRYNGYLDELIWLNTASNLQIMVDKSLVSMFTLQNPQNGELLNFRKISHRSWYANEASDIYAQVIYDGAFSLMAYRNIRKTGDTTLFTESGITVRATISPAHEYFLITPENEVHLVRNFNRRTFMRMFPDHRAEIRMALRGIRIQTDAERVVFISRLDELIGSP
jgi:hypothetical protein